MFHRLLSLALIAGTAATAGSALAQELPIGDSDGGVIELGSSPSSTNEIPKASGFPELTTPDEPPLPYIKEDDETIVLPPPANAVDPKPVKPALKAPEKPVVKAPQKPAEKAPKKPVVKAPAKPVVKVPAKPQPAPKATVKPRLVVPLPRSKPKFIVKRPEPVEKVVLPKAPVRKKFPETPAAKKPVKKAVLPQTPVLQLPESETPLPDTQQPETQAPKLLVPKNLVPKTPALALPAPVTPELDKNTPQDTDIEINQLETIAKVPADPAPEVLSGPILDIPIVGVEVAPEPEEQPAAPQKRKSNRIDRN